MFVASIEPISSGMSSFKFRLRRWLTNHHLHHIFGVTSLATHSPCGVAVDELIDGFHSEGEVVEPGASVRKDVEKCGENCGSNKVR